MTLAKFVSTLRNEMGLTQIELAEKCGMSSGTIATIEIGKSENPTAETVFALAKGLEVNIASIFDAIRQPVKPEPKKLSFDEALAHTELEDKMISIKCPRGPVHFRQSDSEFDSLVQAAFLDLAERRGWPITVAE